MFGMLLRVRVKPKKRKDFIHFIKVDALVAELREPGTVRFDLYQDPSDKNAFFLYEAYVDRAAFEKHKQNEPYKLWESWIENDVIEHSQHLFESMTLCALTSKPD